MGERECEKVNCDFATDVSETYLQRDKMADMIYLGAKITLPFSLRKRKKDLTRITDNNFKGCIRHDLVIFFLMRRTANRIRGDVREKKDKEAQIRLVTRLDIDLVF